VANSHSMPNASIDFDCLHKVIGELRTLDPEINWICTSAGEDDFVQ
jgi:hypothetical protein